MDFKLSAASGSATGNVARSLLRPLFFWAVLLFTFSFLPPTHAQGSALDRIKKSGQMVLITSNDALCYYVYRDHPMGFEYDLATLFSKSLGVKLKVITPPLGEVFTALNAGKGDLVAANITVTPLRESLVDFSDPYMKIQQEVIIHEDNDRINRLEDLGGKVVYVRRGTAYEERLQELTRDGLDIKIALLDDVPTEELIRKVAAKEIEATICDSHIARLNERYYPSIRAAFPVEEPQSLAWAAAKGDTPLLQAVNSFFLSSRKSGSFGTIHQKYYGDTGIFDYFDTNAFRRDVKDRLPLYIKAIRGTAEKYGFDWKLIASLIYEESGFDPKAERYPGMEGILQFDPESAAAYGIKDRRDPAQSIQGGVRRLKDLYAVNDGAEDGDRMRIALASYSVGLGHVRDAQKIAEQKGMDPRRWSSLEKTLPLLSYYRYFKRTKYGYCRGTEPVRYVRRIMTYYAILQKKM